MWPFLFRPKTVRRTGKPDKEQWQLSLLLPMADAPAQALATTIKEAFVAKFGKVRPGPNGMPFKRHVEADGTETDLWIFSFSKNVETTRGAQLSPPVVTDSAGNPWDKELLIGNGSEGRVAFSLWNWDSAEGGKGVSLNLDAVRVLVHQPYVAANPAEAFGDPEPGVVLAALQGKPATSHDDPFSDFPASEEEVPF